MAPTFSTKEEAFEAVDAVEEVAYRLPVVGASDFGLIQGALAGLRGAISATAFVAHDQAGGTHRFRLVHQLDAISDERTT